MHYYTHKREKLNFLQVEMDFLTLRFGFWRNNQIIIFFTLF